MAEPKQVTRLDDAWLIDGQPLSMLSREQLEQVVSDLIEDNSSLAGELGRAEAHVSAGFDYRTWRAKPLELRKAGAEQQIPGLTE